MGTAAIGAFGAHRAAEKALGSGGQTRFLTPFSEKGTTLSQDPERNRSRPGQPTASDIAAFLERPLRGASHPVRDLVPFPNATPRTASFLSAESVGDLAAAHDGTLVLALASAVEALRAAGYAVIESEHPKYDLARVHAAFFAAPAPASRHASAVVGDAVVLGRDVGIGPGAVLDGEVEVGDGAVIGANVRIAGPVRVGCRVEIGSCAVIGEAAFSFGFGPDGSAVRFPATGGVVIEDDVEIGPGTYVAAGIFEPTLISRGAKLADLVSVSNAVRIGPNTIVTARCAISGRARIGADCWIGQSAAIRQGVTIGDGALVGMGSVVVKDVAADAVVMGNPATPRRAR